MAGKVESSGMQASERLPSFLPSHNSVTRRRWAISFSHGVRKARPYCRSQVGRNDRNSSKRGTAILLTPVSACSEAFVLPSAAPEEEEAQMALNVANTPERESGPLDGRSTH